MTPEQIAAWLDHLPPDQDVPPRRVEVRLVPADGTGPPRVVAMTLDAYAMRGMMDAHREGTPVQLDGGHWRVAGWRDLTEP